MVSHPDLGSIVLVPFLKINRAENVNSVPRVHLFLSMSNCEVIVRSYEV
jgi:hypothetical protein